MYKSTAELFTYTLHIIKLKNSLRNAKKYIDFFDKLLFFVHLKLYTVIHIHIS